MLLIELDILDALETVPGMTVTDPAESFVPVINAAGTTSPYLVPPPLNCLMLRPVQLQPGWATHTKFMAGDFGSPTGWENQQVRGTNDFWQHNSKSNVTALGLNYSFPANVGWFLEFRGYAVPKSLPGPILDMSFGQNFQLVISSDGTADLYDLRQGTTSAIGTGNIANGKSFVNQDVSLVILPYRQKQILIWSPTLGGWMDVSVTPGKSRNITEPCSPRVYSTVTPASAFVSLTPLLYVADGNPALDAPPKALKDALAANPTFTNSIYDHPAETACTLDGVTTYTEGTVTKSFVYSVTMQGNTEHQSAEEQGVGGIAASTSTASGDSVFGGGSYPYSLYTPFLYTTVLGYDRTLGPNEYTSNTLSGILSAEIDLSKNRSAKSFQFVLDNPGEVWTSLKDLQNRRTRVYFTSPSVEAAASSGEIEADPDPDTPIIVAYGNKRVLIFDGYSDQPVFTDGTESEISIKCQGMRKRLKNYLFPDSPVYDGMEHTAVMVDVLKRALFVSETDLETTGMGLEIITAEDDTTLPAATPGGAALFSPAIGSTAEDFVEMLQNFTGWILDDIVTVGATNACWYWVPDGYFASEVYSAQGAPEVYMSSTYNSDFGGILPSPDQTQANQGLGSLVAMDKPRQTLEELIANTILVLGQDDAGNVLVAQAVDQGSISDRTQVNYIGEPRYYILISESINTQETCNKVCAILYTYLTQAKTHIEITLPDYYPQLGIGAELTVQNYWVGTIESVKGNLSDYRNHTATYTILKNVA
jgi:hypothetical protein